MFIEDRKFRAESIQPATVNKVVVSDSFLLFFSSLYNIIL